MPMTGTNHAQRAGQDRTAGKAQVILAAARAAFLEKGYLGTSMDEVAALARVSKVTVYRHFTDKHTLFTSVVITAIEEAEQSTRALVDHLGQSAQIGEDLRAFARQHIIDVTKPHLIKMRRMIIAEVGRSPGLAQVWHRRGPEQAHHTLARQIKQLVNRGILQASDPLLAAQHLNYLILSVPINEAMFTGRDQPYSRRHLQRYADEAVRVFLAAYQAPESSRPRRPIHRHGPSQVA
jgi:TetR/AcrR family transcriptional regulator, mexJK operon transcriptional repressor